MTSVALLGNMDSSDDGGPHQQRVNTFGGTFRNKHTQKKFISVTLNSQFQEVIVQMI